MPRGAAIVFVIVAALLDLSCAGPVPPIPTVPLEGLDADVRSAIQKARDEAVAQPRSAQASGGLGMVLEAHDLYQPAVLAYRRAIRLEPKEFSWRYYMALSLQQTAQLDQSLTAISDALRIRQDYTPAVLKRAELLFKLGRFKESEAVLKSLLAQDPNSAAALYLMGRVKFAEQDFTAAEDLYRRACQAYPKYGAAWFGLAEAGKRLGHTVESAKNYELAESYKDNNPPDQDLLLEQIRKQATGIENRITEAKRLMNRRQFDEATRIYKEVLKRYPDNPDCLVNLLYMAQFPNQASPAEVEDLYARARRANPQLPQVYLYYGTALSSQGKYDAAVAAIGKAIELKPDDAEAHSWLADVREKQKRPDLAIEQYRAALAAQPSYRAARLELGKLLLDAGRNREVIPVLLPALQVEDSYTPVVMMFLAYAYLSTGDRDNAREYLKQAHIRALKTGPPNLLAQIEKGLTELGSPL
jgi:tetratricopeptide (TPR) repeat protein